jgi:hypothetical protein
MYHMSIKLCPSGSNSYSHIYSEEGAPGVLIYASKPNFVKLEKSMSWFMDGIFNVCLRIFTQVFMACTMVRNSCFCMVLIGKQIKSNIHMRDETEEWRMKSELI